MSSAAAHSTSTSTSIPSAPRSRSPSPPPALPQPQAPGPRATALQSVFIGALTHTLRACSYNNFASCFPTPATYVPGALDGLHRDFVWRLEEVCKKEFANLLDERQVVPSLNELDQLIADAKRRRERAEANDNTAGITAEQKQSVPPTPPHLIPAHLLLSAHLAPFLTTQTTHLTQTLSTLQTSNTALASELSAQRAEIDALLGGLEHVVADLEGAGEVFGGEEMRGVEGDVEMWGKVVGGRGGV